MKIWTKIIAVFSLTLGTLSLGASAQQPTAPLPQSTQPAPAPQAAPIVRSIEIQYVGPVTISKERVRANLRTKVGQPYSETAVDEDVRNLYKTGTVSNARIFGEPTSNGVKVVVVIQSKGKVSKVLLLGVTKIKAERLRKKLSLKPGSTLDETKIEKDRQKILSEYRDKGFANVTVKADEQMNKKTGDTVVTYDVNEGQKVVVTGIDFRGNTTFKTKRLRKLLKTKPHNFIMSIFTDAGKLKENQLQDDLTTLREFYQNHGYLDVNIAQPDLERRANGDTIIVITISEGKQYHVNHVSVAGAQVFSGSAILQKLKDKDGAVYSPEAIRTDVKTIQDMYGARGYIDLQVTPETTQAGNGRLNVAYNLIEGTQSYLQQINITGNTKTKDKVIRRELTATPGNVYDTVKVETSKKRLENMNYFSRVDAYPSSTLVPGRKDLNIRVTEKPTGSLNFGAGFSSIDSLLGFAEISQSNFDILNWPHFTGGGQHFRARVQLGTETKDAIISLEEPYFLDQRLSLGGELFYHDANYYSDFYSNRDYGFAINVRKPLTNFLTGRVGYRLENIGIYNVSNDASDYMKSQARILTKSSITLGLTHDTRDSVFLTRTGHRVDLSGYVAGGPLGGQEDIYGFNLEGTQYFHLPWDTIFTIDGQVSAVNGFNSDQVPIWDALYLGGANNLRGFKFRDVAPKDNKGNSIGGRSLARLTFEYTFPIISRVRGAVFYDTGFVNAGSYDYGINNLASDVGIGVRLNLPIGPVRIDYGIPVESGNASGHSGQFNFNIGYQF